MKRFHCIVLVTLLTAAAAMAQSAKRTLFVYWGRRGALSQFVLGLAAIRDDAAIISISQQNELFDLLRQGSGRAGMGPMMMGLEPGGGAATRPGAGTPMNTGDVP